MMNKLSELFSRTDDDSIEDTAVITAIDIIQSHRRRTVIEIIHDERRLDFSDLIDRVTERESDGQPVSTDERNRVWTSVYQTHVPRLAAAGIIRYDPDARVVAATAALDDLCTAMGAFKKELDDRGFQVKI